MASPHLAAPCGPWLVSRGWFILSRPTKSRFVVTSGGPRAMFLARADRLVYREVAAEYSARALAGEQGRPEALRRPTCTGRTRGSNAVRPRAQDSGPQAQPRPSSAVPRAGRGECWSADLSGSAGAREQKCFPSLIFLQVIPVHPPGFMGLGSSPCSIGLVCRT